MKEFISIAFMLICGLVAYGIFSSVGQASDSTALPRIVPSNVTPKINKCYGAVTVGATGTPVTINCAGNNGDNPSGYISITNTPTASCGSNMLGVGVTYSIGTGGSYCCGHNAWGSCNCTAYYSTFTCQLQCAPVTAPASNCQWR